MQLFLVQKSLITLNVNARLVILTFLCKAFSLYNCSFDFIRMLRRGSGLDFASGMAASFHHGFLKIVLKQDSDGNSFKKRLEKYETDQEVIFPFKKLFVLIPKSCCLSKEFEDEFIEIRKSLDAKHVSRAGLTKRSYRVGVYGFKEKMKPHYDKKESHIYVTAISATPLITFHEFLECNPDLVHYKTEVLVNFVKELKRLMSLDKEIKELVEIVEFDGKIFECSKCGDIQTNLFTDETDEICVGRVLKQRIQNLWSQG